MDSSYWSSVCTAAVTQRRDAGATASEASEASEAYVRVTDWCTQGAFSPSGYLLKAVLLHAGQVPYTICDILFYAIPCYILYYAMLLD